MNIQCANSSCSATFNPKPPNRRYCDSVCQVQVNKRIWNEKQKSKRRVTYKMRRDIRILSGILREELLEHFSTTSENHAGSISKKSNLLIC